MAGDRDESPRRDPAEERLLRRLRLIAGLVIIAMIALSVTADNLGRLFIDPNFHASELIIGTLIGAIIALAGIEGVARLPGIKK